VGAGSSPIEVGEVLSLAEQEYLYGTGGMRLHVTMVPRAQMYAGYVEVIGYPLLWNDARGEDRVVYVDKKALPAIRARSKSSKPSGQGGVTTGL
jgi:hypothetical protein